MITVTQSCSSVGYVPHDMPCDERFEALFPSEGRDRGLEIVGKIRMELPRYRIRGICRILYLPDERLRIDFHHASLFGAIKEEITVLVSDSLVIYDQQDERFVASDSALAVLRRAFAESIEPDDIRYALLLGVPRCSELEGLTIAESGSHWELRARWRDRNIAIRGERALGPREFKQCFPLTKRCYRVTYDSYATVSGITYPRRVELERENGAERVDLQVTECREVESNPSMFDPDELDAR